MAKGREYGEGARGSPTHGPAAVTLARLTTRQPTATWAFLSGPSAALTHPPAVADSGNKTSPTARSPGPPGVGRVTAGPTGALLPGLAAKQTAIV